MNLSQENYFIHKCKLQNIKMCHIAVSKYFSYCDVPTTKKGEVSLSTSVGGTSCIPESSC